MAEKKMYKKFRTHVKFKILPVSKFQKYNFSQKNTKNTEVQTQRQSSERDLN